ncbi:MAG TPA: tetratricopeptide repeat protein, partial [bacterium]|nr:tetratricopeptide repeat protein [bacterium]
VILILLFIVIWPISSDADKAAKLNKKGIELYGENKLEESTEQFTEALVERPDSPELRFNHGTALSATGKKDEAVSELDKAANTFENKELSAAARFNSGNTFFTAGELNEAIEEYKKALKLDQASRDIRHNLELAIRRLQEQQQQQKQRQQKNEDEDQEKDESEDKQQDEQEQDKESEEKDDNSEKDNQEQQNNQNQQSEQPEQSQEQESERQPMTPEEAQRILDAIEDEEKKAFSLRREKMRSDMRRGDDW